MLGTYTPRLINTRDKVVLFIAYHKYDLEIQIINIYIYYIYLSKYKVVLFIAYHEYDSEI